VRAAEPTGPIGNAELSALFAPLGDVSRIALAVSGGGDSLALLDCIDRWRRSRGAPPDVIALTVDHGLRQSSPTDAATVASICRERGVEAKILRWPGPKPQGDIEAAARAARYRLLLGGAREAGASHLLLAHHRDDQAETLLLRLARGSGLFGLAAMRREIAVDRVMIFRPLLGIARARLAETVAVAGLQPLEDVMNTDPRFARARLRRIMPLLAADGIDSAGLAATAGRLAEAAEALDSAAGGLIAAAVDCDDMATVAITPERFFGAPAAVWLRSFVRLLLAVGGELYPPRHERLRDLAEAMKSREGGARFKRTLAGAVVEWRGGRLVIYREIGRNGLPEIRLEPGFQGIWDHRFDIALGSDAPGGLRLAALGETGRRALGARAGLHAAGALAALPAFWRGDKVRAVPALGYFAPGARRFDVTTQSRIADRLAEPPRFPDFLSPG
jgi:tRNA(Ile)-lysidine synthase